MKTEHGIIYLNWTKKAFFFNLLCLAYFLRNCQFRESNSQLTHFIIIDQCELKFYNWISVINTIRDLSKNLIIEIWNKILLVFSRIITIINNRNLMDGCNIFMTTFIVIAPGYIIFYGTFTDCPFVHKATQVSDTK